MPVRRRRPLRFDYATGSMRGGAITLVGETRVVVAERQGTCWRIGHQSRKDFETGYLTMHDSRCYSAADVKRVGEAYFGPDTFARAHRSRY
jgi:hypothetical protein